MRVRYLFFATALLTDILTGQTASAKEKRIALAWDVPPRAFDPRFTVDADSQYLENLVHCSLFEFDRNGSLTPSVASSYSWKNPTQLEIKIKKDIQFSDGTILTAKDVKSTFDSFKKTPTISPKSGGFSNLDSIDIRSPDTLIFKLKTPDVSFIANQLAIGLLPQSLATTSQVAEPAKIIGCGAFLIQSSASNEIILTRNPKYNAGPIANLDQIIIKIVRDESTRLAKLRTGEIDISQNNIGRDQLEKLSLKAPHLKILKGSGLNTAYIGFNVRDGILEKVQVRRAIASAIRREDSIKYILRNLASTAVTLLRPDDKAFNADLAPPTYDLESAKRLLDQAGYPDPDNDGPKERFTLTFKTTTDATRIAIAKQIASNLRKIGIRVKVEPLEWGKFKADVDAGRVQLWSLKWVGFKDPDIYRFAFATESFPPNGGNRGWYSNKELDQVLTKARTATDSKARTLLYHQAQAIIDRDIPYVFLWHEDNYAVVNKRVKGFEIYADGRYNSLRTAGVE